MKSLLSFRSAVRHAAVGIGAFALLSLISPAVKLLADDEGNVPGDAFVLLLQGIYDFPLEKGPDFGLDLVDLDEGGWSRCDIYRVSGLPGTTGQAVGDFYVDFDITICAYKLPGGAFTAVVDEFLPEFVEIDGELYMQGTAELTIVEATGIYKSFVGGSIHMEFVTHIIDDVTFDEYCFCYISRE